MQFIQLKCVICSFIGSPKNDNIIRNKRQDNEPFMLFFIGVYVVYPPSENLADSYLPK